MRERMRLRHLACIALQGVVTDLARRIHGLFQIALLQTVEPRLCLIGPDTRKTVGL